MTNFDKALQQLKTELYQSELVQEFLRYKKLISESEVLAKLENRLKELQQLMTKNVANAPKHREFKNEYNLLKKQYDTHPYITNYNNLLSDLNALLIDLKLILDS